MRGDADIIVFLLILATSLAITIAFAIWILGFPWEMHKVPDIALSVNVNKVAGNEWELILYFYNKGTIASSIMALEINEELCGVKLMKYGNQSEILTIPGDELYLRPGEKVVYVLRTSEISGCGIKLTSGSYVKISAKTNYGTTHVTLVQLP